MRNFGFSSAPSPSGVETTAPANARQAPHGAVVTFSHPQRLWGRDTAAGAHGLDTQAKPLFPFPPRSIRDDPVRDLLKPPDLGDALLDVLMTFVTTFGFIIAVLFLLFIET